MTPAETQWRVVEYTKGTRRWYRVEWLRQKRRGAIWVEAQRSVCGYDYVGHETVEFKTEADARLYAVNTFSTTQRRIMEHDPAWEREYKKAMKRLGL